MAPESGDSAALSCVVVEGRDPLRMASEIPHWIVQYLETNPALYFFKSDFCPEMNGKDFSWKSRF